MGEFPSRCRLEMMIRRLQLKDGFQERRKGDMKRSKSQEEKARQQGAPLNVGVGYSIEYIYPRHPVR